MIYFVLERYLGIEIVSGGAILLIWKLKYVLQISPYDINNVLTVNYGVAKLVCSIKI